MIKRPNGYWADLSNQRAFLEELALTLGFHDKEEKGKEWYEKWYAVSAEEVVRHGGQGLLSDYYGRSMYNLLRAVFPEHEWLPWRFPVLPKLIWKEETVVEKAVRFVENELHLRGGNDWKRVRTSELEDLHVFRLFEANGGVSAVIRRYYPDVQWEQK